MHYKEIYQKIENISSYITPTLIILSNYFFDSFFYLYRLQIYILIRIITGDGIESTVFTRNHSSKLFSLRILKLLDISLWIEHPMKSLNKLFIQFHGIVFSIFLTKTYNPLHITAISGKDQMMSIFRSPQKCILKI